VVNVNEESSPLDLGVHHKGYAIFLGKLAHVRYNRSFLTNHFQGSDIGYPGSLHGLSFTSTDSSSRYVIVPVNIPR